MATGDGLGAAGALRVGIVCGSRSDFPIMEKAVALLRELGVASELRVMSAHRTPELATRYAETAAGRGIEVLIAGAGGAAHLAGVLASKTLALDGPDAARSAGRHGRHRGRGERRPAGRPDHGLA
jgi:hypothetical protein